MKVRPHQQEALDAVAAMGPSGRALVVMACGTGKTKVGRDAACVRAGRNGLIMVFVPSKLLVRQTYLDWRADLDIPPFDGLLVYSDPPAEGATATTDETVIAQWIASKNGRLRLLVCTYQSADRVAAAYASTHLPPADVMVLDEGHWTAGVAGHAYSLPLHDDKIPATIRLTLTATARVHPDGDGTRDVVSMDDPAFYGERVYQLTFGEAIHRKLLADFRVAVVVVTDEEVRRVLMAQQESPRGDEPTVSQVAAQIATSRAIESYGIRRIIGFHSRVDRSKAFTRSLRRIAANVTDIPIEAKHIDGTTPQGERQDAIRHLAHPRTGGATVLSNVAVFTEGVDVPAADAVIFADPKTSRVAITQAVGRALRLHPEKGKPSVVILPVYLTPGESPEQALASSDFRHVWAILSTLRDHDERLDSALTLRRIALGQQQIDTSRDSRVDLPDGVEILGGKDGLHDRLKQALTLHLLEGATEPWLARYGKLKAYMDFTGAMPKSDYIAPDGDPLGRFAQTQKAAQAKGTLLPSRRKLLEELPGWRWAKRRLPPVDDEALNALVKEWLSTVRDHSAPDRRLRMAAIAARCAEVIPGFELPWTKYRAHTVNAVLSMRQAYQVAQRAEAGR